MNTGVEEGIALAKAMVQNSVPEGVTAVICPPFTHLAGIADVVKGTPYQLGAQNVSDLPNGAMTGEVSTDMLKELGVSYVIIGHSERREIIGETDALITAKTARALNEGLKPILCVGENLDQREAGTEQKIVADQLHAVMKDLGADPSELVIAYEPIWAIGTGKTASAAQAEEMCAFIKETMKELAPGVEVPVLYGGSVKPDNIEELLAQSSIDGALVGGASLKADSYQKLVEGRA